LQLSDNQKAAPTKSLRSSTIDAIITSLPAAASQSDCRRRSHPDCRATAAFHLHKVDQCARLAEDAAEPSHLESERRAWLQILAREISADPKTLEATIALLPME
jgi:hypothetical protein